MFKNIAHSWFVYHEYKTKNSNGNPFIYYKFDSMKNIPDGDLMFMAKKHYDEDLKAKHIYIFADERFNFSEINLPNMICVDIFKRMYFAVFNGERIRYTNNFNDKVLEVDNASGSCSAIMDYFSDYISLSHSQ